jgi:hypothetical protein
VKKSSRPLAVLSLALLAAAMPWLIGSRDPIDDARDRLAAMTPAQRKAIEENREKYDRLSSLEQYDLRELSNTLAKLDSKERTELEATMGRLAAWVATFPDEERSEYEKALPNGRREILKRQLAEWKKREREIAADVAKAEALAKRPERPGFPRGLRDPLNFKNFETQVKRKGSNDDRALLALVQPSMSAKDRAIIFSCLVLNLREKPGKGMGPEAMVADALWQQMRLFPFVPAFRDIPTDKALTPVQRMKIAEAITSIYLLSQPNPHITPREALRRFGFGAAKEDLTQHPVLLLQQLALLKDYSEQKKSAPLGDKARVKQLLGK